MAENTDDPGRILMSIWQGTPQDIAELDEECSPNKACRNMKDVTFDGFAEEGVDMATAWKNKLAREGKLAGQSLGDLVLQRAE
jgi:hypothetical protein